MIKYIMYEINIMEVYMKKSNKLLSLFMIFLLAIILIACNGNGQTPGPGLGDEEIELFLDKVEEQYNIPTTTKTELTLPRTLEVDGLSVSISWLSSNIKYLAPNGVVNQPDEDLEITLDALIGFSVDGSHRVFSRSYKVVILGVDSHVFPLSNYNSDYGFAHNSITDRNNEAIKLVEVSNEIEFIEAMYDKYNNQSVNTVIKITNDLNMGARHVRKLMEAKGYATTEIERLFDGKVYREHANHPMLHPTLMETGVGHLIIQVPDLMIYSEEGITIRHMSTHIKDASNIVIRNLHLTGIWEWDEESHGDYDANDWDYFTIERTKGVWIDHLETNASYDGLIDIKKNTEDITISYLFVNGTPDEFIETQILDLERRYQEGDVTIPYYTRIRDAGASVDTMIRATATVKKGFNFGNTTAGTDFEMINVTIHHTYFKNLQDRIPRLRKGDVHLYNVVVDSEDVRLLRNELANVPYNLISQGMVPTEQSAVLMENSRVIGVAEPIKTHQEGVLEPHFTGRYFVKDSIYDYINETYYGSTGDYLSKWEQSNTNVPKLEDFFFRNNQLVPYNYEDTMIPALEIKKALMDNGVGSGSIEGLNWLQIRKILSVKQDLPPSHKINGELIELPESIIDIHNPVYEDLNPLVRNFYDGPNFQRNKDYKLDIDKSQIDLTKPGEYFVIYTFSSLIHEDDVVVKYHPIMVYDGEGPNEIFTLSVTDEFNSEISMDYRTYRAEGTLFYYLSDDATLEREELIELSTPVPIESTSSSMANLPTNRMKYLYLFTLKEDNGNEVYSDVQMVQIKSERIVELRTGFDVNRMITDVFSKNTYYILMNDIDLSDTNMGLLSTQSVFSGVFDGNNFTLSGLGDEETFRTRGGLFHTITNGMIKDLVIDDFFMQVGTRFVPNSEDPNIIDEIKPQSDAGILATYIYNYGRIENVVIKNSTLRTNRNYGAALLGRVRTGVAEIERVSLYNVVIDNYEGTNYSAGFIGSGEANTQVYYKDIFAQDLSVEQTTNDSDMIGGVSSRVRSSVYVDNIVFYNVRLKGPHNLGLIFGKEDTGAYYDGHIRNAFLNAEIVQMPRGDGNYSSMFGYAIGNRDYGVVKVENFFATETNVATGYPRVNPTIGTETAIEPFVPEASDFLDTVTEAWWQVNLPALYNSDAWVVVEGRILPANHTHFS